mgnify:CR=1 FL=1
MPWPRWTTPAAWLLFALWLNKLLFSIGQGVGWNMLWLCHVGTLLLCIACLLRQRRLAVVASLWVMTGLPVWAADAWAAQQAPLASVLSHGAGFAVALYIVRAIGVERWDWLVATLGFVAVQALSRGVTPPALNVNLAHGIYRGWENMFPSYWVYNAVITAGLAAALAATQWLLGRWSARSSRGV